MLSTALLLQVQAEACMHLFISQLRMKQSSSNCPNQSSASKNSIKKRNVVRRTVRIMLGEQTGRPIKNRLIVCQGFSYRSRRKDAVVLQLLQSARRPHWTLTRNPKWACRRGLLLCREGCFSDRLPSGEYLETVGKGGGGRGNRGVGCGVSDLFSLRWTAKALRLSRPISLTTCYRYSGHCCCEYISVLSFGECSVCLSAELDRARLEKKKNWTNFYNAILERKLGLRALFVHIFWSPNVSALQTALIPKKC